MEQNESDRKEELKKKDGMSGKQKVVRGILAGCSFLLALTAVMCLFSWQRIWHELLPVAAMLELIAVAALHFAMRKK